MGFLQVLELTECLRICCSQASGQLQALSVKGWLYRCHALLLLLLLLS
jgi:hypothetical protein